MAKFKYIVFFFNKKHIWDEKGYNIYCAFYKKFLFIGLDFMNR